MTSEKQWITVKEAAERSGYAISTIQELLREGKIEGWKPGHDWFTTLEAVMKYKENAKMGRPKKEN